MCVCWVEVDGRCLPALPPGGAPVDLALARTPACEHQLLSHFFTHTTFPYADTYMDFGGPCDQQGQQFLLSRLMATDSHETHEGHRFCAANPHSLQETPTCDWFAKVPVAMAAGWCSAAVGVARRQKGLRAAPAAVAPLQPQEASVLKVQAVELSTPLLATAWAS